MLFSSCEGVAMWLLKCSEWFLHAVIWLIGHFVQFYYSLYIFHFSSHSSDITLSEQPERKYLKCRVVFSNTGPIFGNAHDIFILLQVERAEIAFISNPQSVLIVQHVVLYLKGSICMNISGWNRNIQYGDCSPTLKLKEHIFVYLWMHTSLRSQKNMIWS